MKLQTDHIDKLKVVIQTKTDMNTTLDLQNQSLQAELQNLKQRTLDT